MKYLKTLLMITGLFAVGAAQAESPFEFAPQVGFYLAKNFGAQHSQPMEIGARFDYGSAYSNSYHRDSQRYRPAMFDLRFNTQGVTAFETGGVNALRPAHGLAANGDEGFMSRINWGYVGFAAFGVGIYVLSEKDRDDRDDRLDKLEAETADGS